MPDNPQRPPNPNWAWQEYRPDRSNPWNFKKAGHLLRRTGFGPNQTELQAALRQGPTATVDQILAGGNDVSEFEQQVNALAANIRRSNNGQQASAWWLYRMLYSPHPFREKMTLFWHDHFATSNLKVNNAGYMIDQYQLMARNSLGNFATMLQEITLDPAMMIWLDTVQSRRGQPNENYARELMELFSLGITDPRDPSRNNYTEEDIRQAARAFTGYRVVDDRGVFREHLHDPTEKTVFGQTGRYRGPDIVRLCLAHPACPYFIVKKLFAFLVSDTFVPSGELLAPLAREFQESELRIQPVVRKILRSNIFYSNLAYRTKIKSPIEFSLGIVRALEGRVGTLPLVTALEGLGQRLFYPPSVAGWDEGEAWLNGQTLLFRHNLALGITSTVDGRFGNRCDPAAVVRDHNRQSNEEIVDFLIELFVQGDVPPAARSRILDYANNANPQSYPLFWTEDDVRSHRTRALCHLILTQPEFQLS